jgi:hypothetical protein
MADVNPLEEKLAEVIGLAEAAQKAVEKVASLPESDSQSDLLERLGQETAILDKAQETKNEGVEMMESYLGGDDADGLDGFEFLTMTEAGEAGHWAILGKLNEKAGEKEIGELVDWALPLQEAHLDDVREASLRLAAEEDPYED